jgi:hypothetical protein
MKTDTDERRNSSETLQKRGVLPLQRCCKRKQLIIPEMLSRPPMYPSDTSTPGLFDLNVSTWLVLVSKAFGKLTAWQIEMYKGEPTMEEHWIAKRSQLRQLLQDQPHWTNRMVADAVGMSVSWVKDWKRVFRRADPDDEALVLGQPRYRRTSLDAYDAHVIAAVLDIRLDSCPPRRPDLKPFAERSVRTLKHECLWVDPPEDWLAAAGILDVYRANQSLACGNHPPYEAFPELPSLPHLPDQVDPDAWPTHYHRHIFKRRVGNNGMISVGRHEYYVDDRLTGERVGVLLDAELRVFPILHKGSIVHKLEIQNLIGKSMAFQAYLKHMLEQARTLKAD